jgi:hypothetical protein
VEEYVDSLQELRPKAVSNQILHVSDHRLFTGCVVDRKQVRGLMVTLSIKYKERESLHRPAQTLSDQRQQATTAHDRPIEIDLRKCLFRKE